MEEPLEPHFPILPTMDDFDKLTADATLKYKTFMDIIASSRAELDQMKLDIVEKITIHERVIIDLMADIDRSSKNARILRSDLDIVWNNCQGMKDRMSELLDTLKLEFNLMKEQSMGNVEGVKSLCKWGSGLLKSRLCFLTSKNHKQDYKQRGTTTWG